MRDKDIEEMLEGFNQKSFKHTFFIKELSPNVSYVKTWMDDEPKKDNPLRSYQVTILYLIKNDSNKYIGAVVDMGNDLHWFIEKSSRKKGYLTNALRNIILSHLSIEKEEQRITIDSNWTEDDNFNNSESVAFKCGFIKVSSDDFGKSEYVKNLIGVERTFESNYKKISEQVIIDMRRRIQHSSELIKHLEVELEIEFGEYDLAEEISLVQDNLSKISRNIDNLRFT